ncbi:MAG: PilZ domain-containing protein [Sphingomonadales bacterium]|nr:PilZ domain-containing protein [Sphingomonadales bacterium]
MTMPGNGPGNRPDNRPDSRSAQRIMTVYKAARIGCAQADDLGLIRNISTEGVMVETQLTLGVDETVFIEIQSGNPMPGRVRWTRDGMTGIQLDRPIDLTEALRSSGAGDVVDRIRPPRFDRSVEAALQCDGHHWSAATRNISLSGAQIGTDRAIILPKDAHAMLRIDGLGTLGGVVRWRRGSGIGIRFEHPLPLRHFQQWLHQFGDRRSGTPAQAPAVPAAQIRAV